MNKEELEYIKQCVNSKDFCGMLMTKDKIELLLNETERLNNIINELEEYLEKEWLEWKDVEDSVVKHEAQAYKNILDKLKELKENKWLY